MANNYQSHCTHYRIKEVKYANGDVKYQIQEKDKHITQALFWLLVLCFTIVTVSLQLIYIIFNPDKFMDLIRWYARCILGIIMQWHDAGLWLSFTEFKKCEDEINQQIKDQNDEYAASKRKKESKKQKKIAKKLSNKVISTRIID